MPRKHSSTSAARVGRSSRAGQALELRKGGLTFRQIGQRMGFSEQRAHTLVTEELQRLNTQRAEAADAVTRLEVERLDSLLAAVWPQAMKGVLTAIDRVLAILARRAKMLGIDADKGGNTIIMQQAVAQTAAMTAEERKDAMIAILTACNRPWNGGPESEAGKLLAILDGEGIEREAQPATGVDDAQTVPYGLRELTPADSLDVSIKPLW